MPTMIHRMMSYRWKNSQRKYMRLQNEDEEYIRELPKGIQKLFVNTLIICIIVILLSTFWPQALLYTCVMFIGIIILIGISYCIYKKIDRKKS